MSKNGSLFNIEAAPTVELIDDAYALYEAATLRLLYCNPAYIAWFNIQQSDSLLDENIPSLKKATLFKRIDKRGYYSISIDTGSRGCD